MTRFLGHSFPTPQNVRSFAGNRSGAVSVIVGICTLALFLLIGGAIDFSRWLDARTKTQAAIDSAVLATARALQTNGGDQEAAIAVGEVYFAQGVSGLTSLRNKSIDLKVVDNGTGVVGSTKAKLSTPIMGLAGVRTLPLFVQGDTDNPDVNSNGAEFAKTILSVGANAGTNIEISLMLDVTGSMCDDGSGPCTSGAKLDALKAAAKDLVNIVVWDDQSKFTSRVAVVPFSTRVRVADDGSGGGLMKTLTNLDPAWSGFYNECTSSSGSGASESGGNWNCNSFSVMNETNWKIMPCPTDRTGPQEFTDAAPGANAWLNAHGGDRMPVSWDSADTAATDHLGKSNTDPADHWNYNSDGSCGDVAQSNTVLPLSSDKALLDQRIDGLEAYGSTAGALGTAWAWYMLSPDWGTVWPSVNPPAAYSDLSAKGPSGGPKLRKIAVLMTDGSYNTYRGWKDQNQGDVSNNAKAMCTNMNAKGIEVYAVAFKLDELPGSERSEAEKVLKACGSTDKNFYNTTDAEQLKRAFRDIALQVSTLYLTK
jgi:Flp pilus assembly protein TadG